MITHLKAILLIAAVRFRFITSAKAVGILFFLKMKYSGIVDDGPTNSSKPLIFQRSKPTGFDHLATYAGTD